MEKNESQIVFVESIAKWLLRVTGAVVCLSCFAILIPTNGLRAIHEQLGLGDAPGQPVFEYMARSLSAMYFAHGLIVLVVAADIVRYWSLLLTLGLINIILGVVCLLTDLSAPMPWWWVIAEGPPIAANGLLMMGLWWYRQRLVKRQT